MPDLTASLDLCSLCPKLCNHVCPVYRASSRETWSPQNKMASLLRLQKKCEAPGSGPGPGWADSQPLYACTACGACTTACLHKVEPANHLVRGRALAERHEAGHPALHNLPERTFALAQKITQAILADGQVRLAQPGGVGILPSCMSPQHASPVAEAQRLFKLLDALRPHFADFPQSGLLPVGSAGYPLYAAGLDESFRLYAESLSEQFSKQSVLVAHCSVCTYLLKVVYPQHGVPVPKVLHVSEFLLPFAAALPVKKPLQAVRYHAPCHLERRLHIGAPLQILHKIAKQVVSHDEFEPPCCGAAGLLPQTDPQLARAMAHEAMADQNHVAIPTVSGCPTCAKHLLDSGYDAQDLLSVLEKVCF